MCIISLWLDYRDSVKCQVYELLSKVTSEMFEQAIDGKCRKEE